jgi:hypothetical protein
MQERRGICWSHATTVGNIAVASGMLRFVDGRVACDFTPAGKYRNGAARWWCRTHQAYWGVKADLAAFDPARAKVCSMHAAPLEVVLDPLVLDLARCSSVRISASSTALLVRADGIDGEFAAIAITGVTGVFANSEIAQVNVTPPAVLALAHARGCLDCARCRYPHLDLGAFAVREHRRHYCGNCGNDSTHSKTPIVSNPLFTLSEHFAPRLSFE